MPTAANAALEEHARRQAEHHHPATDVPQGGHDGHEGGGVEQPADHRPTDLAEGHVVGVERGGQHRVVEMGDLQLEEEVEDGVDHRPVHGRGGEEGRCDKSGVGHLGVPHPDGADQATQSDADGEEEQERFHHPGEEEDPMPEIEPGVPLQQEQGAPAPQRRKQSRRQRAWPTCSLHQPPAEGPSARASPTALQAIR